MTQINRDHISTEKEGEQKMIREKAQRRLGLFTPLNKEDQEKMFRFEYNRAAPRNHDVTENKDDDTYLKATETNGKLQLFLVNKKTKSETLFL